MAAARPGRFSPATLFAAGLGEWPLRGRGGSHPRRCSLRGEANGRCAAGEVPHARRSSLRGEGNGRCAAGGVPHPRRSPLRGEANGPARPGRLLTRDALRCGARRMAAARPRRLLTRDALRCGARGMAAARPGGRGPSPARCAGDLSRADAGEVIWPLRGRGEGDPHPPAARATSPARTRAR
jgi:hypothetical protein